MDLFTLGLNVLQMRPILLAATILAHAQVIIPITITAAIIINAPPTLLMHLTSATLRPTILVANAQAAIHKLIPAISNASVHVLA